MHFLLTYSVSEDFLERRTQFRKEHLDVIQQAHDSGLLIMAGATTSPITGEPTGAALVFTCEDASQVEEFAKSDPYVSEGLVTDYRIDKWNTVVGEGSQMPKL